MRGTKKKFFPGGGHKSDGKKRFCLRLVKARFYDQDIRVVGKYRDKYSLKCVQVQRVVEFQLVSAILWCISVERIQPKNLDSL